MGEGVRGGVSSARVSSHLFLSSLLNHYQIYHCLIITKGPGGTPLYRLYRYVRRQRVWFFSRLVWNRVPILTILVLNRVWFVHASLELGMCFRRSYFFIVRWCEQELNRSEIGYEIFDQVWNGIGKITDFQVWNRERVSGSVHTPTQFYPPPPTSPETKGPDNKLPASRGSSTSSLQKCENSQCLSPLFTAVCVLFLIKLFN